MDPSWSIIDFSTMLPADRRSPAGICFSICYPFRPALDLGPLKLAKPLVQFHLLCQSLRQLDHNARSVADSQIHGFTAAPFIMPLDHLTVAQAFLCFPVSATNKQWCCSASGCLQLATPNTDQPPRPPFVVRLAAPGPMPHVVELKRPGRLLLPRRNMSDVGHASTVSLFLFCWKSPRPSSSAISVDLPSARHQKSPSIRSRVARSATASVPTGTMRSSASSNPIGICR
jgi:hypothetical protein